MAISVSCVMFVVLVSSTILIVNENFAVHAVYSFDLEVLVTLVNSPKVYMEWRRTTARDQNVLLERH